MSLPIHHHAPRGPDAQQPLVADLTLRRGRVHEFCGPSRRMLAALVMAKSTGTVVWIRPDWMPERLNAAGLQPLADPARLILASTSPYRRMLLERPGTRGFSGLRKRRPARARPPGWWPNCWPRPP